MMVRRDNGPIGFEYGVLPHPNIKAVTAVAAVATVKAVTAVATV
jgi:hypothetical protein